MASLEDEMSRFEKEVLGDGSQQVAATSAPLAPPPAVPIGASAIFNIQQQLSSLRQQVGRYGNPTPSQNLAPPPRPPMSQGHPTRPPVTTAPLNNGAPMRPPPMMRGPPMQGPMRLTMARPPAPPSFGHFVPSQLRHRAPMSAPPGPPMGYGQPAVISQPAIIAKPAVITAKPVLNRTVFSDVASSTSTNIHDPTSTPKPSNSVGGNKRDAPITSQTVGVHPGESNTTGEPPSKKEKKKKDKRILRTAAAEVWEDQSLTDWDPDDFRVFCGDLGNEVTDEKLMEAFKQYPSLQRAKVVRDKRTYKTKGYGFLSFSDPGDYTKAMREMNGKYVGNRPIKLRKSNWKDRNIEVVKKKEKEKKKLGFR